MSRARPPPLVTGISPKEGAAWTKVTIRGENLGTGPADLIGNEFIFQQRTQLCLRNVLKYISVKKSIFSMESYFFLSN